MTKTETKAPTATELVKQYVANMKADDEATIKEIAEAASCTVARVSEVTKLHVEVPLLVRGSKYGVWQRNPEADPLTAVVRKPKKLTTGEKVPADPKATYEKVMADLAAGKTVSDARFEAAKAYAKDKRKKQPKR